MPPLTLLGRRADQPSVLAQILGKGGKDQPLLCVWVCVCVCVCTSRWEGGQDQPLLCVCVCVCVCVFGEENKQVGLAPWIVRWSREWCSGLSGSGPGRAASNGDPGAGTLAGKKVGKVWYSRESPDQLKHAPHLPLL